MIKLALEFLGTLYAIQLIWMAVHYVADLSAPNYADEDD